MLCRLKTTASGTSISASPPSALTLFASCHTSICCACGHDHCKHHASVTAGFRTSALLAIVHVPMGRNEHFGDNLFFDTFMAWFLPLRRLPCVLGEHTTTRSSCRGTRWRWFTFSGSQSPTSPTSRRRSTRPTTYLGGGERPCQACSGMSRVAARSCRAHRDRGAELAETV